MLKSDRVKNLQSLTVQLSKRSPGESINFGRNHETHPDQADHGTQLHGLYPPPAANLQKIECLL